MARASRSAALAVTAGCARFLPGPPATPRARAAIFFIGDGMGIAAYTATRLWKVGATGRLAIDTLPHTALVATHTAEDIVADSAAAATALLTGVQTRNFALGWAERADAGDSTREGPVPSVCEVASHHGLAIGIVTTARVTDATPAACYAHVRHRAVEEEIAAQLLEPRFGSGPPAVILGGGRSYFLPAAAEDPEYRDRRGLRSDGRDLIEALVGRGYTYIWNRRQFDAVDPASTSKLVGLFEPDHMRFERERAADPGGEPTLAEMTELAIRILSRAPGGYFLLVEGGRIDHALHANNAACALEEAAAFDDAVSRALALTSGADTLVVVTADHSHGLAINGYPKIGLEHGAGGEDLQATRRHLLGAAGSDARGRPYPTLSFATGPGGFSPPPAIADSPAAFALPSAAHTGEDVLAAARGPGAKRVAGFLASTDLFFVVRDALGLGGPPGPGRNSVPPYHEKFRK